jgi:hypothetical protein
MFTVGDQEALMDWTPLAATALGGLFVLAGDLTSRIGARRQDERSRRIAQADAERAEAQQLTRDREREVRARARQVADAIFQLLAQRNIRLGEASPEDVREFAFELQKSISLGAAYMPDAQLRQYLFGSLDILDSVTTGDLPAKSAVYAVRENCRVWLGAWVRGEADLPKPTESWTRMRDQVPAAVERFRSRMLEEGYVFDDVTRDPP